MSTTPKIQQLSSYICSSSKQKNNEPKDGIFFTPFKVKWKTRFLCRLRKYEFLYDCVWLRCYNGRSKDLIYRRGEGISEEICPKTHWPYWRMATHFVASLPLVHRSSISGVILCKDLSLEQQSYCSLTARALGEPVELGKISVSLSLLFLTLDSNFSFIRKWF